MSFLNLYYHVKPLIPRRVRVGVRRWVVRRQAALSHATWPIDTRAARAPDGWTGWPEGKQFSLVLTHDVETARGLEACSRLADLDESYGFRSCFNFVPERYTVPPRLRDDLQARGFEVALHGLKHDGKLFYSREVFETRKPRINHYLAEWGARGFRAPLMLRDPDWIHGLDIDYDASTFDTDPFEPQPEGVHTIFPYHVRRNVESTGYVELPYTLPQDSTLFLFKQEESIEIWKRKLDWIAEQGGMAMLITHPDYMCFSGQAPDHEQYPSRFYEEFLDHIRTRYGGAYWHCLPREMAAFWREQQTNYVISSPQHKVWIDLDNTPHVPFFEPIVKELHRRGFRVLLTARDAFQVREMAERVALPCRIVGRHHGKNRLRKLVGLAWRSCQLAPHILRFRPVIALSHGSRSQMILTRALGIRSILIDDYEHSKYLPFVGPDARIVPEVIRDAGAAPGGGILRTYPGMKEDVYVPGFSPDPSLRTSLGIAADSLLVTVRPPANEAHYHRPESDVLFDAVMDHLLDEDAARIVVLPRTPRQAARIASRWSEAVASGRILLPDAAVDGLNLMWHSDLVVSGGGTMNREAAALGVPVYSIFRGELGAVDRHLAREGRLTLVKSVDEVAATIRLERRSIAAAASPRPSPTLSRVVDAVVELIGHFTKAGRPVPHDAPHSQPKETSS